MYRVMKLFLCTFLVAIVGLNVNTHSFAASAGYIYNENFEMEQIENMNEGEVSTLAINYYTVSFERTSSTSAKAKVSAQGSALTTSMTSEITLQKYNNSTGAYYNVKTVDKEVSGRLITHTKTFSISTSGQYRIMVVVYDNTTAHRKYKELL